MSWLSPGARAKSVLNAPLELLPLALVTSQHLQMRVPGSVLPPQSAPPTLLTNALLFPAPSPALQAMPPTPGPCPLVLEDPGPLSPPLSSVIKPGVPLHCTCALWFILLRLLVTGGYDGYAPWTAEVWDPSCGNTTLPDLPDYRFYHSLDYVDGKVHGR